MSSSGGVLRSVVALGVPVMRTTGAGEPKRSMVPFPFCPWVPCPQHPMAPVALITQAVCQRILTCTDPVVFVIGDGASLFDVSVPPPTVPASFVPQHDTVFAANSAHETPAPASTESTPLSAGTTAGPCEEVVPSPSCPVEFSPQQLSVASLKRAHA